MQGSQLGGTAQRPELPCCLPGSTESWNKELRLVTPGSPTWDAGDFTKHDPQNNLLKFKSGINTGFMQHLHFRR